MPFIQCEHKENTVYGEISASKFHLYAYSCAPAVVVFPTLMDPNNGQIELSDMLFGSTATYNCDTWYNFNGSMLRVCMAGGQWSWEDPLCWHK